MRNGKFDAENWINRLADALQGLEHVQQDHGEELDEQRSQDWPGDDAGNRSERYIHLYWSALSSGSRYHEQRYGPVRAALTEARHILSRHPVLAELPESSCGGEIRIRFVNREAEWKPSAVMGGLMARGLEAGENGFKVACSELNLLLDPDADPDPIGGELLTGCHVILIQGLIFGEEIPIGDGLTIMPFDQLEEFVDDELLDHLVPGTAKYRAGEQLAAIVKPFPWRPEIGNEGESPGYDWSKIAPFFEDVEVLIELLSLFHAAPVVRVASIPWRFHKRACLLLGEMDFHHGFHADTPSSPPGWMNWPIEASRDAVVAAARTFAVRNEERYWHCAPIIARLGEALARQGRFATDDRILDVAIALERMYELDHVEISFKLRTRAACFLESRTKDRLRVFKDVQELYNARSGIVHSRGLKGKPARSREDLEQERKAAFDKGFNVARRSVLKLLKEGPPRDWNEMLLEAHGNLARDPGDGAKTTITIYSNRKGQTVVRRTGILDSDFS